MPKTSKSKTRKNKIKQFYSTQPWECRHHKSHSEIVAYVEASGTWEIIATINTTAGVSAEAMAQFICGLINDSQNDQDLLREAMKALESVVEEGLNYSTEQNVDEVIASIKKRF